jgi:hypothetical protein
VGNKQSKSTNGKEGLSSQFSFGKDDQQENPNKEELGFSDWFNAIP